MFINKSNVTFIVLALRDLIRDYLLTIWEGYHFRVILSYNPSSALSKFDFSILSIIPCTVWSSSFATLQYSVAQPPVAVGSPTMASSRSLTIAFMLYEAGMLCYSTLSVIYTLKMKSPTPQIRRLTIRKKNRASCLYPHNF